MRGTHHVGCLNVVAENLGTARPKKAILGPLPSDKKHEEAARTGKEVAIGQTRQGPERDGQPLSSACPKSHPYDKILDSQPPSLTSA